MEQHEAHTVYEHPIPAVIMHWFHLVTFLVLAFTGLVIHFQPIGWPMSTIINLHFLCMFIFVATAITRIYWAFMGMGSAEWPRSSRTNRPLRASTICQHAVRSCRLSAGTSIAT